MDRFRWCSDQVEHLGLAGSSGADEEAIVLQQLGVRLYDGSERTSFDNGALVLTTHRLLWKSSADTTEPFVALPLAAVLDVRLEEGGGLVRSRTPKLVLRLLSVAALQNALASLPHPLPWIDRWRANEFSYSVVGHSYENHVKLGFTRTGDREFLMALKEVLQAKVWAASLVPSTASRHHIGAGIGAIQRQQAARAGITDTQLEEAFDDLNKLMTHAKEIVMLSRNLARRARDAKDGQWTTNETAELRSAMLSVGISDEYGSRQTDRKSVNPDSFHTQLAHQLCDLLTPLLTNCTDSQAGAGCIDLPSVYCRINRARGMQLISPDDLLRACHLLEREQLPLRLKCFPSGLLTLQLASENESETLKATAELVHKRGSLTADEMARATNLPTVLVRERLLAVEDAGLVCRDDSEAGLRFYPNLFLTRVS
ncbi:unnamed protein product [Dicrocoelium dendriticum]|nr:unnamed protein product [Dicrocoelium dendriticum]